jgi:hypothetical protein
VEWTSRLGQRRYQPPPDLPGSNTWKTPTPTDAAPTDKTPTDKSPADTTDGGDDCPNADADLYPNAATPAQRRTHQTARWTSELNRNTSKPIGTSTDDDDPEEPKPNPRNPNSTDSPPTVPWQKPDLGEPPF